MQDQTRPRHISHRRALLELACFALLAILTVVSAISAKRHMHGSSAPALARLAQPTPLPVIAARLDASAAGGEEIVSAPTPDEGAGVASVEQTTSGAVDPEIRYFNGRPVRPARVIWMTVTAYSPDHRSCGKWADGVTASNKSVWTNAMKLVAADTDLLPFGSLLSVPGYDNGKIVPVLDRGGAIKGARLDVLYPTHQIARRWGVQRLPVTVWEYAD